MTQTSGPSGPRRESRRPAHAKPQERRVPVAPKRRRRFPWRGIALTMLALVLVAIGLAGLAYSLVDIPKPNDAALVRSSAVFWSDETTELAKITGDNAVNREMVGIDQVPLKTRQAVIAAEDRDFYDNPGVSISGTGRAILGALRGKSEAGGGSTITQQYVKNYFLTSDQTLTRKGKEIVIAVKIDRELSKEKILEDYLNTIFFGRNAYGIQAAAKAYFDKDVSQLDVAQSAFIAAVLNSPSSLDPRLGPEAEKSLLDRWTYVLDGMQTKGWLTAAERKALVFPKPVKYQPPAALSGPNGHIMLMVEQELKQLTESGLVSPEEVGAGGLKVVSTIDVHAQSKLNALVADKRKELAAMWQNRNLQPSDQVAFDNLKIGATAVEPDTGAVLAVYGGNLQPQVDEINWATARLSPGSTMKAFTTIASLRQGLSTRRTYDVSSPLTIDSRKEAPIRNWQDAKGAPIWGSYDVRRMLAESVNTAFVRLNDLDEMGKGKKTAQAAKDAGLDGPLDDSDPSNVLGGRGVMASPYEMANAFATLAAEGRRATPHIIKSVTLPNGTVRTIDPQTKQAFTKEVAADATDALEAVTNWGGLARDAQRLGRPVAGKTGTATGNKKWRPSWGGPASERDGSISSWFAGYTPDFAMAVAISAENVADSGGGKLPLDGLGGTDSGAAPTELFVDFAKNYLKGKNEKQFPQRVGIGDDKLWTPPPQPTWTPRPQPTWRPTTPSTPTTVPTQAPTTQQPQPQPTTSEPDVTPMPWPTTKGQTTAPGTVAPVTPPPH